MILDLLTIKNIILKNPNKNMLQAGQTYSQKLRMHMYGDNLDNYITLIKGFERPHIHEARKKYCKSNKDLFARLGRPIDKVFSARGGSVYYNLNDRQDRIAATLASNVQVEGHSVRQWMEDIWRPHYLDDPFGVIFMEIMPVQQALQAVKKGVSFVYPTYKASSTIYDYQPKGSGFEYIIFNVTSDDKEAAGFTKDDLIYRVVDDAFDYWIRVSDRNVFVLPNHTFPNYFMQVPAMINSDIPDPLNDGYVLSLFDSVIDLAQEFLTKGSIKVTHDFMHGFPKYSEFADDCNNCNGSGFVGGESCPECKGTGKRPMTEVSKVKLLEWPKDKNDAIILPNEVGGYIEPSKTYHDIATNDMATLETCMMSTLWGTQNQVRSQGMQTDGQQTKTATEVISDYKPMEDRLKAISKSAETRHKFIIDSIIRVQMKMQAYAGSSVSYGRRYIIEGPDVLKQNYLSARQAGAPIAILDDLLNKYYDSEYESDEISLGIAKKLIYVEPFVHNTIAQCRGFGLPDADYKAKLFFQEWLSLQSDGFLLASDIATLRQSLYQYSQVKQLPVEQPVNITERVAN